MTHPMIHVAYAYSCRNGWKTYRAVAVATRPGIPGHEGRALAVDDTAESAVERAVAYVQDSYRREGLPAPESIVRHGRKRGSDVDSLYFIHRELKGL